jgi:formylglycine-generating enzyme required for sulfatase activity
MKKVFWYTLFLIMGVVSSFIYAQASFYGKSYAIVIGINQYSSAGWKNLNYAEKDARGVAAFLRTQGFELIPLYNRQASKENILTTLQDNLARKVRKNDRVIVFFSGHGYTETLAGKDWGYIIPSDAKNTTATYISMEELQTISEKLGTAKHQLFIIDACFGGLLGTRAGGVDPTVPNYLTEITRRSARQVLAAGGKNQQVVDGGPKGYSYLVGHLLEALEEGLADLNGDGYITFPELDSYITPRASNAYATPATGYLRGHGLGEFVFISPRGATTPYTPPGEVSGTTKGPDDSKTSTPEGMVLIPGSWFDMGDTFGDGEDDEKPVHQVYVNDFYLGKHEVTVGEFRKFVRATGYRTEAEKGDGAYVWDGSEWVKKNDANWLYPYFNQTDDHPVVCVSWNDVVAYCNWRSEEASLKLVYTINGSNVSADFSAKGYRLPNEAEWEYAARSGNKGYKYSWGNGNPSGKNGGNIADEAAKRKFSSWSIWEGYDDGYIFTAPIGSFNANEFGLFDMTGNVWEWCWDWYGSDYYKTSPGRNPRGPESGSYRVLRGGSWDVKPDDVRSASRGYRTPDNRGRIGFRISRTF